MNTYRAWLVGAIFFGTVLITSPASAVTFPGENGTIAVTKGAPSRIWTVDPSGGTTNRMSGAGATEPAWSPDGRLFAYVAVALLLSRQQAGKMCILSHESAMSLIVHQHGQLMVR